jgi:hypothetical protein
MNQRVFRIVGHGLVAAGAMVDEGCFLMTLVSLPSQFKLFSNPTGANAISQALISHRCIKYTVDYSSYPGTLYWERQPDLEHKGHMYKCEYKYEYKL